MRVQLIVNGFDMGPYIQSDGLTESPIERIKKSVVVMDGTEYRTTIEKIKIDVKLLDMPDNELRPIENAIALHYPAIVTYTSKKGRTYSSVPFYPTTPTANAKKVLGDTTYWSGISFTLEEK